MRSLLGIVLKAELCGDHHLSAERLKRFTHEFLVGERPIDFSRIEEGDAALNGCVEKGDHLLLVGRRVAKAHAHTARPKSRSFQVAVSKCSFLHWCVSLLALSTNSR